MVVHIIFESSCNINHHKSGVKGMSSKGSELPFYKYHTAKHARFNVHIFSN